MGNVEKMGDIIYKTLKKNGIKENRAFITDIVSEALKGYTVPSEEIREKVEGEALQICVEALRAAEMRQGCTNHTYYAEILLKQLLALFDKPVLSDEELLHLNEQWELEYEDIEMTDAEWEMTRWKLIARAQRDK